MRSRSNGEVYLRGLKRAVSKLTPYFGVLSCLCVQGVYLPHCSPAPREDQREDAEAQSSEDFLTVRESYRGQPKDPSTQTLQDQIQRQGGWNLNSGGAGGRMEVQLRGAGGHQSGIYIDDLPITAERGRSLDLNLFPLDLFEGVQLEMGGEGAQGGSGEMGGRLSLLTPNPDEDALDRYRFTLSTERWLNLGGLINANHERGSIVTTFSLGGGPNRYPYTASDQRRVRRSQSAFSRIAGITKAKSHWSSHDISLLIGAGLLNREEPGPEGLTFEGRESEQNTRFVMLTDQFEYRLSTGLIKIWTAVDFLWSSYSFVEENPLWQESATAMNQFSDQRTGLRNRVYWHTSKLQLSLKTELSDHRAQTDHRDGQRTRFAMIPQADWAISTAWTLRGALRFDLMNERSMKQLPTLQLSWRSGVSSPWRLWLKGSQTWRDPGFDELYLRGPSLVPNPELQAEEGQWYELGLSKRLRSFFHGVRLSGEAGLKLFTQRYQKLINYIPIDPYRIRPDNIEGARVDGLESSLKTILRQSRYRLLIEGRLNLLDHESLQAPQTPLPLRPSVFGQGRISGLSTLMNGHIEVWWVITGRGQVTTDRYAERVLPPQVNQQLGLSRTWRAPAESTAWHLIMRVDNLLNRRLYDYVLQPSPGRSILFTLGYDR